MTVERPGSAYTLGESMVHQAVMGPHTVSPRRKRLSHAAEELMPPRDRWPAAAIPGDAPEESRSCTLTAYQDMRTYLIERDLIG